MPKKMPKTAGGTNGSYGYHFPVSREPLQFQLFGFFHGFASFFFSRMFSRAESVLSFFLNPGFFSGEWEAGKMGRFNIHQSKSNFPMKKEWATFMLRKPH